MSRWMVLAVTVSALVGWAASTADARTLHYRVSVTVTGPGHVTAPAPPDPNSTSIDCPSTCNALMKQNSTVTFTATPDTNATFGGWGGDCSSFGTGTTCTIQLQGGDGSTNITAGFDEAPPPPPPPPPAAILSIAKNGTGTGYVGGAGGIDCGPTCSATFFQDTKVTLLAVPDDGSTFTGWSGGGCAGTDTCSVTLATDTQVMATFTHLDRAAPHLRTIRASAPPGKIADLRFRVFDDSGKSRELLTIVQGKVTIGRVTVRLGTVVYGKTYTAHWPVPRSLKPGARQYCGVAIDAAGNRSIRSCSAFKVT